QACDLLGRYLVTGLQWQRTTRMHCDRGAAHLLESCGSFILSTSMSPDERSSATLPAPAAAGDSPLDLPVGGGEMGERIRAFDWSNTSLGPSEHWPESLWMALRIMLASRQPIWVGWGPELTFFYNDAYKAIIGGRHPWAFGRPTHEIWREIW